jgi:hypothetical protein
MAEHARLQLVAAGRKVPLPEPQPAVIKTVAPAEAAPTAPAPAREEKVAALS